MSLSSRLKLAGLHLVDAIGTLVPLPQAIRRQQEALMFARAMQGYQLTSALGAARDLELLRFLDVPRSLAEVAEHCKMSAEGAEVLLDALDASGVVRQSAGQYFLTWVGRSQFAGKGWTAGEGLVDFMRGSWGQWRELATALQTNDGHPGLKVYNPDNPLMAEYIQLSTASLAVPAKELMPQLDLSNVRRMICGTVGTSFAAAVLEVQPKAELIVSCLPLLIEHLPSALEEFGLDEPFEVISNSGDATEDNWGQIEEYDLVFLARKFAFCDDAHGIEYLEKSMHVLPPGGYLILWEPFADNYDLVPWMRTTVGLVDAMLGQPRPLYKKEEVAEFARRAGYDRVEIHDVVAGRISFIVARRPGGPQEGTK